MDDESWKKRYYQEKSIREEAERLAEEKARETRFRNEELTRLQETLEEKIQQRTDRLRGERNEVKNLHDSLQERYQVLLNKKQALDKKVSELEKVSQYKSEFVANISHELRTPLNSLMILTSLMVENQEKNLTEDQIQSLQIIFNSANELLEIIEEVLDMSKAEAGELSINKKDVLLSDVWRSLQDQFLPVSKEKGVAFAIERSDDLPKNINIDKKRLKQILKNLLSNAFKFTSSGGEVRLLIRKEVWNSGEEFTSEGLVFQVQDSGIGIAEEKWEQVFQMFKQAEESTSHHYGGTGLGLSISRKLARLMGGDLILESQLNQGTTFTLNLPPATLVTKVLPADTREMNHFFVGHESSYEKTFSGQRILLVDDDLRSTFALSKLLQTLGLQVQLADSGENALAALEASQDYDLVLLDLIMPKMDGQQVLEAIRSQLAYRMLPVIIVTASDSEADELRCRGAGADDYLVKPIEVSVLVDRLRGWLQSD